MAQRLRRHDFRVSAALRQMFYKAFGGNHYADIGCKARACVDHDRRCAEIAASRK